MGVTLDGQLVVAISSRALFDFEEENRFFEQSDDRAYMKLQLERLEQPAKPGVAMTVVGSLGVDTVYVARGGVEDCTLLGSGQDLIYFTGNWGDYIKVISGSVLTFSRTVDGYNESVKVVGSATNISLNDRLVFADGAVYSGDAKTALTTSLLAEISLASGYDTLMKTLPGASEEKLKNSPAVAGQAACLSFGKCAWRFFGGFQARRAYARARHAGLLGDWHRWLHHFGWIASKDVEMFYVSRGK
jgi:hypothetical protein